MELNKTITATLNKGEREKLLGYARNVDEVISEDDFVEYIESLIDKALFLAIEDIKE